DAGGRVWPLRLLLHPHRLSAPLPRQQPRARHVLRPDLRGREVTRPRGSPPPGALQSPAKSHHIRPMRTGAKLPKYVGVLPAVLALTAACTSPPTPGEFGPFRFAGRARGRAPLNLLPPVSDRSGNIYILYGGINVPETEVFVGRTGGGWTSGCKLSKGDR